MGKTLLRRTKFTIIDLSSTNLEKAMATVCNFCNKKFSKKSNLIFHQKNAQYCIEGRGCEVTKHYECDYCNKILGTKYTLKNHLKLCYMKKEHDIVEGRNDSIQHYKDKLNILRCENRTVKKENQELKIKIQKLEDKLNEHQGIVKGMQSAPDKKTIYNTAYVHPKLVNLPIGNIRALTTEFIDERVSDGILTYEKAAKGYSGMLEVICELITHENANGEIERNYVCTDVSRNSFHRLLESKKWRSDKGGRYLNDMVDRFIEQMDEYKNRAYDIYDKTPHDSMNWAQVDWERKNISLLFSGVVCKEGTGDREELINALRKEIAKRASV